LVNHEAMVEILKELKCKNWILQTFKNFLQTSILAWFNLNFDGQQEGQTYQIMQYSFVYWDTKLISFI
jgi:hypothetical protein